MLVILDYFLVLRPKVASTSPFFSFIQYIFKQSGGIVRHQPRLRRTERREAQGGYRYDGLTRR